MQARRASRRPRGALAFLSSSAVSLARAVLGCAELSARLPDVRADHQLGDEIRTAERLLDDLANV